MLRRFASPPEDTDELPQAPTQELVERILRVHPSALAIVLEWWWSLRARGRPADATAMTAAMAGDYTLSALGLPGSVRREFATVLADEGSPRFLWDHLIYAYLVENTRAFDVFAKVVTELLSGERLGILQQPAAYQWLRTTEELFLKDASPFQAQALVSRVRPDLKASRRNAYYRMFGMDLNHGSDGSTTYPYQRPEASNRDFVPTLEEFLREVWRAIENSRNTSGPNVADPSIIANLARRLQDMLNARRGSPTAPLTLLREEYEFVTTMAWFHLTLLFNTPIVVELKATATSPEERLRLIGERVGIPTHARSHSYFILAPAMSTLLLQIEAGEYSDAARVPILYGTGVNPVRDMVASIINQWSVATGRDLKAPRVTVGAPPPAMAGGTGAAVAATAAPTGGNGRTPAATSA